MTPDYTIRRAERTDQVAAATQVLWLTFELSAVPLSPAELDRVLARPNYHLFLAEAADGTVLGVATVQLVLASDLRSTEALLWDLAVHPDHQRRGIGRALVAHVRAWAEAEGHSAAFVLAEGDDAEAIAFYRRLPEAPEVEVRMFSFWGG